MIDFKATERLNMIGRTNGTIKGHRGICYCYTKGYSDYYDLILCGYINIIMYIVMISS